MPRLREWAQINWREVHISNSTYCGLFSITGVKYIARLQDYAEAVRWYRKAADLGSLDPQHLLGCFYFRGRGISRDHTNAVKWYREAAERRLFPS